MDKEEFENMALLMDHWYFKGKRDLIRNFIGENKKIMEVGCGIGQNILWMDQSFGVELDMDAINYAREKGISAIRGNALKLPVKENSLDLVLILDVIEHLEDDVRPLEEIYKTLKPNGILIVMVPAYKILWRGYDDFLGHKRRYNPKEIRNLLTKTEFRILRLNHWNFLSLIPAIFVKFLKKKKKSDLKKTPKVLNEFLFYLLKIESMLVRNNVPLPAGLSIFAMAKKDEK